MNRILFDQERETRLYGERKFAEGEAVGEARGRKEGEARGEARGAIKKLYELFEEGIITLAVAAKKAGMSEEAFRQAALQS